MIDGTLCTPEDLKLIEGCKRGDRRSQRELYDKYASRMYSVCIRYMGDRESAKDVLQDGFITLFDKISLYKGEGSFEGWIRRIFANTALMQLRKKDVLKESEEIDPQRNIVLSQSNVVEQLEQKELLNLITQMPAGYRAVFNMYIFEGMPHEEIAKVLGITVGASRSQLSRGRLWLQERVKSMGYRTNG